MLGCFSHRSVRGPRPQRDQGGLDELDHPAAGGSWSRQARPSADGSTTRWLGDSWSRREVGLSTQVNTTVTRRNVDVLPDMVGFVREVGAVQWSVFFLVPVGRGQELQMISPAEHERVLAWLHDLSLAGDFDVKATAAPMYRQVVAQRAGRASAGAGFAFHDGGTGPCRA